MLLALIAAISSASTTAPPECTAVGDHDPQVLTFICDAERMWAESVATGDSGAVEKILADDFVGVDPKGKRYHKMEMVADTATAPNFFKSNQIGSVLVRFYGDMAVAHGSETWTRKNGKMGRWVWTDTWLKRDGRWQIIAAEDLEASAE